MLTPFESGYLLGLLAGEGHFGGDGRGPQVTLRMHVRHEKMFRWLEKTFPDGRLYGPYSHGGREYYQWMVRGRALKEELLPILQQYGDVLDDHVRGRVERMCRTYNLPWLGSSAAAATQADVARGT